MRYVHVKDKALVEAAESYDQIWQQTGNKLATPKTRRVTIGDYLGFKMAPLGVEPRTSRF
jgi:hypothetical protein